ITHATMASPIGTARMPTQGSWRPLVLISVSAPYRSTVRRGVRIDEVGLTAKRQTIGCPVEMPPKNAARMVGKKHWLAVVAHAHFVGILLAAQRRRCKARADLDSFDSIDAHESRGEIAVELAVDRRAETNGHAFRDDLDDGAHGGTALADVVEIGFE